MAQTNTIVDHNPAKQEKCYIQARGFFFAAKRCGRTEICEESGLNQNLLIPECVNIAFSCELYFKVLLYKNQEVIREHSLFNLFNQLDDAKKKKISESLKMGQTQLKSLIKQHSNLFNRMRYRSEFPQYSGSFSVPLQFFYQLAESLDKLARELIDIDPYPITKIYIDNLQGSFEDF
ncbi:hypothetical protein [Lacrimispora sp.]|uniref:hypothetical protein n=1 Tax=Lacrimispora sp. TaxID=2719234 RepID=UPI0028AAB9B3|nr:hypothetical protein [Lacrimispora sp.]